MSQEEPSYIRALHILIAIGLIVIAFVAIAFFDIITPILLIIIAVAILLMGIPRVINGGTNKTLETKVRIMKIIVGGFAILIGLLSIIWAIIDPVLSGEWLVLLLAVALVVLGAGRFLRGIQASDYPTWFRTLILGIGILTIILAVVIFVIPPVDQALTIILLSITLLFNGVGRLAVGIVSSK